MSLQQILDQKRLEATRIERDMYAINPKTFAYQKLRAQLDALEEQIHVLQDQRDAK